MPREAISAISCCVDLDRRTDLSIDEISEQILADAAYVPWAHWQGEHAMSDQEAKAALSGTGLSASVPPIQKQDPAALSAEHERKRQVARINLHLHGHDDEQIGRYE